MSEEKGDPTNGESLSWFETWIKALTRPSVAAYEEIISDPNAGPKRAVIWIIAISLIGLFIPIIGDSLVGTGRIRSIYQANGLIFWVSLLYTPVVVLIQVVLPVGISQLIAALLGGSGTFSELIYANAAYLAPLILITYLLIGIPYAFFLILPIALYAGFLYVTALKAVHKFGWGKAILSTSPILAYFICFVVIIALVIYNFTRVG